MCYQVRAVLFIVIVLITLQKVTWAQVLGQVTACPQELVEVNCDTPDEVIAVHRAVFNGALVENHGCGFVLPDVNFSLALAEWENSSESRIFSVHSLVNKRCSGVNNCTVSLYDEEPQAKLWGNGKITIQYSCVDKKKLWHRCGEVFEITSDPAHQSWNTTLLESGDEDGSAAAAIRSTTPAWLASFTSVSGWGYINSNSYPRFYHGQQDCRWTLRASNGRTLKITFLDLSIRTAASDEPSCTDVVTVTEGKHLLFNKCGDLEEPVTVESSGPELNVTISVNSKNIYPKRGLLFYFTASGCPTPKAPAQGYLIQRNVTNAEFLCCVDHVFPDSGRRHRTLTCLDGHRWSHDVPDCVDVKSILQSGNRTWIRMLTLDGTEEPAHGSLTELDITYDYVLPATIIAGLLLGNVLIVLALIRCRRQRKRNAMASSNDEAVPLQITAGPSSDSGEQPPRIAV